MANWEREFFALAGTWLSCRLHGSRDLFQVLGELDYAQEMFLLLKERKDGRRW